MTREQTGCIITLYEKYPALYNTKNEQYKNKSKRLFTLRKILEEYKEIFPSSDLTVDDLRGKINRLRTQFFAELGKVKKSYITGTGADDLYVPKLWCYEQLSFLNEGAPVRSGESNLRESEALQVQYDEDDEQLFEGTLEELNSGNVNIPTSRPTSSSSKCSEIIQTPKQTKKLKGKDGKDTAKETMVDLMKTATNILLEDTTKTPETASEIDAFAM